jgi:hypothetical protein
MKRTRRVSVTIEHREISISHTFRDSRGADADPGPAALPTPPVCGICGAPWILVDLKASGVPGANTQQILAELLERGLHPPVHSGGRLWMCGSFMKTRTPRGASGSNP